MALNVQKIKKEVFLSFSCSAYFYISLSSQWTFQFSQCCSLACRFLCLNKKSRNEKKEGAMKLKKRNSNIRREVVEGKWLDLWEYGAF